MNCHRRLRRRAYPSVSAPKCPRTSYIYIYIYGHFYLVSALRICYRVETTETFLWYPLKARCVCGGVPPAVPKSHQNPPKSPVLLCPGASGGSKFSPKMARPPLKGPALLCAGASGGSNFSQKTLPFKSKVLLCLGASGGSISFFSKRCSLPNISAPTYNLPGWHLQKSLRGI